MRFYNQQHRFYCGIDLHARTLAVCILDPAGGVVFEDNLAADPAFPGRGPRSAVFCREAEGRPRLDVWCSPGCNRS